ncbi:hypothetical protein [Terasakiella sp. SH-1]|uniref:PDC sensor domain-containing protein n=1 Tax=Terasakiella sp. SH-1 TaxID=2560057 RepID=UPI0010749817|nr:hypothetical protein [Terasakiella sp. SH-1]
MRKFIVILSFVLFTSSAQATDAEMKLSAEFQAINVEALLRTMDLALLGATDLIERDQKANELIIHEALGRYVARSPGLRAIIATDAKGKLRYDSFKYPAKNVDLQDRDYIKRALKQTERTIYIGTPIKGRTSGIAFLPMSQAIFDLEKKVTGVVAGIITPDKLIRQNILCNQCFVGIYKESGEQIAVYPTSLTYPEGFHKKRKAVGRGIIMTHTIGNLPAKSVWTRIEDYKLEVIFTKLTGKEEILR